MTFTSSNKTPLYENLRAKIFDHKIFFRNDFKQLLKDDFRNVKRIVTDSGSVKFEAMRSAAGHSDITSSIVLGIEAVKQFPVNFKVPQGYMRQSPFGFRQSVF